jgi:hypothetical protein
MIDALDLRCSPAARSNNALVSGRSLISNVLYLFSILPPFVLRQDITFDLRSTLSNQIYFKLFCIWVLHIAAISNTLTELAQQTSQSTEKQEI